MSDPDLESTYEANLKGQIAEKQQWLAVAKEQLTKARQSNQDKNYTSKHEAFSLLETLSSLPYLPQRKELVGLSLSEMNLVDQIEQLDKVLAELKKENEEDLEVQLDTQTKLTALYQEINETLETKIGEKEAERQELQRQTIGDGEEGAQKRYDELYGSVTRLRERAAQLTQFTKTLISDYILKEEFSMLDYETQIRSRRARFLKLLELLLNNALTSPAQGPAKSIEIDNKDDPLIRFLIVNKIIVVDRRNPNRIRLRI